MAEARLILASASPRRLALLSQIGFTPDAVDPADIDETPLKDERPRDYAARLSLEKARCVRARARAGDVVLAADTVVSAGRRILDKPGDEAQARAHLSLLSGRRHRVTSAFAVIRESDDRVWTRVVETSVRFKRLSHEEIDFYIASGEWSGKAGAYAIQGLGARFVPWVGGSYSNVVGLPLTEVANVLEAAGIAPVWTAGA